MIDVSLLKNSVIEAADQAWSDGKPILLSQLGQIQDGAIGEHARQMAGGLATFISEHLSDDLILVRHSSVKALIGVVPRTDETQAIKDFDIMLTRTRQPSSARRLRFRPSFWAAFRKPLDPNSRRFLELDGSNRFLNCGEGEAVPENMVEISREYLTEDDSDIGDTIYDNIVRWCQDNGVEPEKFVQAVDTSPVGLLGVRTAAGETALGHLLRVLDDRDLERMSMPLDVIKKLAAN